MKTDPKKLWERHTRQVDSNNLIPRLMTFKQFRAAVAEILREERKKLIHEFRSCPCGLSSCPEWRIADRIEKWYAEAEQRESGKLGGGD